MAARAALLALPAGVRRFDNLVMQSMAQLFGAGGVETLMDAVVPNEESQSVLNGNGVDR